MFARLLMTTTALALALTATNGWAHNVDGEAHAPPLASGSGDVTEIRRLVESFRVTGSDSYLDRARSQVERMLAAPRVSGAELVTAAAVAQAQHDFAAALTHLEQALRLNPRNDEARLMRAGIELNRGNLAAAGEACRRLHASAPLIMATCRGRVLAASGGNDEFAQRLERLYAATPGDEISSAVGGWVASTLGDLYQQTGRCTDAQAWYQRSLDFVERTQVRSALVDVLLQTGATDAALAAIHPHTTALPLQVRRLIASRQLENLPADAPEILRHARAFETWIAAEDWLHAREMARFYLDVLPGHALALKLARINLTLQQEPEDRLLLARAEALNASIPLAPTACATIHENRSTS